MTKAIGLTIDYLKKSIKAEENANKDYMRHAKTKRGAYLKEIARDERDHLKKHKRHLKLLEEEQKKCKAR